MPTPRVPALLLLLCAPASADTWSSEEPQVFLPSIGGATKELTVDGEFKIRDVDVILTLNYSILGDLHVSIVHPDGTSVMLVESTGGKEFLHLVFDDEAPGPIVFGQTTYTGAVTPVSPLSILDDKPAAGTWTLRVDDSWDGGSGVLQSFSIAFNGRTYVPNDVPKAIPIIGWASSALTIPDAYTIADADVTFTIPHQWSSDLAGYLVAPGLGTDTLLIGNVGGGPTNGFLGTTLDDEASQSIETFSTTDFLGRYTPSVPGQLAAFDGLSPAGVWRLRIYDNDFEDDGTLERWSLHLVPETLCTGQGSATSYGTGLSGTLDVPLLASDDPVLGEDVHLLLGSSTGVSAPGLLLGGSTSASLPFKGGTLLVQPTFQVGLLVFPPLTSLTATLPADASLCGTHVFLQLLVADGGAPKGVALSPGLELLLGS